MRHLRQHLVISASFVGLGALALGTPAVAQSCTPSWVHTLADPVQGSRVLALAAFDNGSGPELCVGGEFNAAGSTSANNIAKWNGGSWSALGEGLNGPVYALCVFDDGGGPALYAAGSFDSSGTTAVANIAKWDGSSWSALGSGLTVLSGSIRVLALTVFDDGTGPALYAGGSFTFAGGTYSPSHVAKWNGSSWAVIGTSLLGSQVAGLTLFDDGSGAGTEIYAGGYAPPAGFVKKWNGSTWDDVGSVPGHGSVGCITTFDDGSGSGLQLHVGQGTTAGAMLRKWDGFSWVLVGGGVAGGFGVVSLAVYDDGSGGGPALYVGGDFTSAGGMPTNGIARWDGSNWSSLSGGTGLFADAFAAFDDGQGGGTALFVGGTFTSVPSTGDAFLAKWGCSPFTSFCPGDGSGIACPCGNNSPSGLGQGCANSVNANGALLVATGSVSPDTVVLHAAGMPAVATLASIFFQGDAFIPGGIVFGDGVRCADGHLIRLGPKSMPSGRSQYPEAGDLPVSVRGGVTPGSGVTRYYQTYYRNSSASFCPPATFNVTNGVIIVW